MDYCRIATTIPTSNAAARPMPMKTRPTRYIDDR
jgi:hypothetical protein